MKVSPRGATAAGGERLLITAVVRSSWNR